MHDRLDYELAAQEQAEWRWLQSCPVCDICGDEIQDDDYWELSVGGAVKPLMVCEKCLNDSRRSTWEWRRDNERI